MLKAYEFQFALLQRIGDALTVSFCWVLAYLIRFHFLSGGQEGLEGFFAKLLPFLVLSNYYYFKKFGLYNSQRFTSRSHEIFSILKGNFAGFMTFVIALYFFSPERVSRMTLAHYLLISSIGLVSVRLIIRNFLRMLRKKGMNLRYYLLMGDGPQAKEYLERLACFKDSGIRVRHWIASSDSSKAAGFGIDVWGPDSPDMAVESLRSYLKNFTPDAILMGFSSEKSFLADRVLKEFYNDLYQFQILPDLSYSFVGHTITDFAGLPLIAINQPKFGQFDSLLKRIFDFWLTLLGIIIISPVLLLLGVLVKLTSSGPIFYGQERMGLDGKKFTMWKFRSMKVDVSGADQTTWTVENDPRRTAFGTFLRESSLDELPQLFNVLMGDMSLVGPRPERPYFVEKFKQEIPAYMLRHKMKAGITGWAQVNGWRGNTSLEKRIECDIFYIRNWSLLFDFKILFLTLFKGFLNKNAY